MRRAAIAFSFTATLPESRILGYGGDVPGTPVPTIEPSAGEPVVGSNGSTSIDCTLAPVVVTVRATETGGRRLSRACVPGPSGGLPDPDAGRAPRVHGRAFAAVGLTAARTTAGAENNLRAGPARGQRLLYFDGPSRGTLWYPLSRHGVTRFPWYAGLAGLWIIRDEYERLSAFPRSHRSRCRAAGMTPQQLRARTPRPSHRGDSAHQTDPRTMEALRALPRP